PSMLAFIESRNMIQCAFTEFTSQVSYYFSAPRSAEGAVAVLVNRSIRKSATTQHSKVLCRKAKMVNECAISSIHALDRRFATTFFSGFCYGRWHDPLGKFLCCLTHTE